MLINQQPEVYLSLANLIAVLNPQAIINFRNLEITNITQHSQQVTDNSLFVAIPGFTTDGHQYITSALSNGATAVIGEQQLNLPDQVPYIQVPDSRLALAKLAAKFYNYPGRNLKLIGVTGSTGKTTTTCMINNLLTQVTANTGLIGSLHTKIKETTYPQPAGCTTPDALELNKRLATMQEQGVEYVSMEVSSHALKLNRVAGLDFDLAIFTNLSYDHLNFHQNLTDYYQSKTKLFTNLEPPAVALFNQDDDYAARLPEVISVPYLTYGLTKKADLTAIKPEITKQGTKFIASINKKIESLNGRQINPTTLPLQLSVLGRHNIYNALAAFITGLLLDLDLATIKQGLENFSGVSRRLEIVYDQEFTIIDDFAHNPASLKANFKTLQQFDYNNLIIVHFLKGNRGQEANRRNAQLITDWREQLNLTHLITTRAQDQVKPKNQVLPEEEAAFAQIIKETNLDFTTYQQLEPAVKHGLQATKPQDLLLLIGGPGLNQAHQLINDQLS